MQLEPRFQPQQVKPVVWAPGASPSQPKSSAGCIMFQSDFAGQAGKDCKRRDVMQMFLASGAVRLPNGQDCVPC